MSLLAEFHRFEDVALAESFAPWSPTEKSVEVLNMLRVLAPTRGHALHIASETGVEVAWLAEEMPGTMWQPTESDIPKLRGLSRYFMQLQTIKNRSNLQRPRLLEVTSPCWPVAGAPYNLIYCANFLHRTSEVGARSLLRSAATLLAPGGALLVRGPFMEDNVLTSPALLALDERLQAHNRHWGLRRREDVEAWAALAGLTLVHQARLANDELLLVWMPTAPRARRSENV